MTAAGLRAVMLARFCLVALALIATSFSVSGSLFNQLAVSREAVMRNDLGCSQEALKTVSGSPSSWNSATRSVLYHTLGECRAALIHREAVFVVAGVGGFLAMAGCLYLLMPMWRVRRRYAVLDDAAADTVVGIIEEMSRATEVRFPKVLWDPLDPRCDAVTFGYCGRNYIALGAGTVALARSHDDHRTSQFRVIIGHELAHLSNHDVMPTCALVAASRAFFLVGAIPLVWYLLTHIHRPRIGVRMTGVPLPLAISATARLAVLMALVFITRNAVLRTREMYADATALASGGSRLDIVNLLASIDARVRPTYRSWSWWRSRLSAHPDTATRVAALDNPTPIGRVALWEVLTAGVVTGVALGGIGGLARLVFFGSFLVSVTAQITGVIVGLSLGAVLALFTLRTTLERAARRSILRDNILSGLALTAGLFVGKWLALESAWSMNTTAGRLQLTGDGVALSIAVLVVVIGLMGWTNAFAGALLNEQPSHSRLAIFVGVSALVVAGALSEFNKFDLLALGHLTGLTSVPKDPDVTWLNTIIALATQPLPIALMLTLWVAPFVGALVGRPGFEAWALVKRVVRLSIWAVGVLFAVRMVAGVRFGWIWDSAGRSETFFLCEIGFIAFIQAAAAILVTRHPSSDLCTRTSTAVVGLFTASVAGTVLLMGMLLAAAIFGRESLAWLPHDVWYEFRLIIAAGTIATLVALGAARGRRSWLVTNIGPKSGCAVTNPHR